MKTIFHFVILLTIGLALVGCESSTETKIVTAPPAATTAGNPSPASAFPKEEAEKLIQRLATQDGCRDSTAEMRLSFTDAEGKPQQMDFRLQRKYEAGKISSLMTVLAPKEETEKALLAFEEEGKPTDAISYLAGLKKTAHLKSDNPLNFRGSKSTVQEMLGLEMGKYEVVSAEQIYGEAKHVNINLIEKKGMNLVYPKIVGEFSMGATETQYSPDKFSLFDLKGELVKEMNFVITRIGPNSKYPTKILIQISDKKTEQKIKLESKNIKFDSNLPASIFTEAQLIKSVTAATAKLVQ